MPHRYTSANSGGWQAWHDMEVCRAEEKAYRAEIKAAQEDKMWAAYEVWTAHEDRNRGKK